MNKILLFTIFLLSIVKYSLQDCCYLLDVRGDGQSSYYVDITLRPAAQEVGISYLENYDLVQLDNYCLDSNEAFQHKVTCSNSGHSDYFLTRLTLRDPAGGIINNSNLNIDIRADGKRCTRSYESCNVDGTVAYQNDDKYCLSFLGCYPKLACYIAIGVFFVVIAGIILAVVRRNSGSAEKAALDRPNTKSSHLDVRPAPINNYSNNNYSNTNHSSNNNKETLIQIEEMPVDFKEAGSTNWVNRKYNSPANKNRDLGLGLGSGGFGSTNSLLPQSSNINVINDPSAGLNRGRSIKRSQSTKSQKKPRSNDANHLNVPPVPALPSTSHSSSTSTNLNRSKSARSAKSVKSTKSTRKPRASDVPATGVTKSKSVRNQQKRYQIPSDSSSDSDSDNEVLGLRAKPSVKRTNNNSSSHHKQHSPSVKNKAPRY